MLRLREVLEQHNIPQRVIADAASISLAGLSQIMIHNRWPVKREREEIKAAVIEELKNREIDTTGIFEEVPPAVTGSTVAPQTSTDEKEEDEVMLLKKQVLFPATKKHFAIFRDPLNDEIQSSDDVFTSPDVRYVREALYQTALYGGFMAIVGESGAGKSTLRRDLVERINRDNSQIVVIEPYILAMEDNDLKGKTLKSTAIAECIINTIAPLEGVKRSQDARFRQLHRVLRDSARAGFSHVLVIEEAHSLPIPTLKHLKRFFELEDGFKKLLSVVLIGQPELALKLSERNMEVREVVQRCEVVTLNPLDTHLEAYLEFKFKRIGKAVSDIFETDAIDAIRARLTGHKGSRNGPVSILYPLAVNNLVTAAMNLAAQIGVPAVTADVIREI